MKSKNTEELINAFESIFKESERFPRKIWFDKEKAIYSDKFRGYVAQFGIDVYSTQSELKAVIIERWNRTLKQMMYKKFTELSNNKATDISKKWVDLLKEVVDKYNNTVHSTIKMKPVEAVLEKNHDLVKMNLDEKMHKYNAKPPKFKVKDHVRITEYNYLFDKHKQNYTDEVFEIKQVHDTIPYTYTIMDKNNEAIDGKFYEPEMILSEFKLGKNMNL